jgi:hypothetical protein
MLSVLHDGEKHGEASKINAELLKFACKFVPTPTIHPLNLATRAVPHVTNEDNVLARYH